MFASTEAMWYLTRGSGLVAVVMLTASVTVGVVVKVEWRSPRWPRLVTLGLHRNLSLLAVAALAVHIATTVVDGFTPIGWLDAVVPFRSPYRTLWLGLGAVAFDLFLAVIITSLLRRHLSYTVWRTVHLTSWGAWPIAMIHGLGTGSDTSNGWTQVIYMSCVIVVLAACWWRLAFTWRTRRPYRLAVLAASIVLPLAALAWVVTGPLQPGWSKRAGAPVEQTTTSR